MRFNLVPLFKTAVSTYLLVTLCFSGGAFAQSNTVDNDRFLPKSFVNSIYIGVSAGLLIGFVTAYDFKLPKNWTNIDSNRIERGASWGLYGGILLGLWVTYVLPDSSSGAPPTDQPSPQDQEIINGNFHGRLIMPAEPRFSIEPLMDGNHFAGAAAHVVVLKF